MFGPLPSSIKMNCIVYFMCFAEWLKHQFTTTSSIKWTFFHDDNDETLVRIVLLGWFYATFQFKWNKKNTYKKKQNKTKTLGRWRSSTNWINEHECDKEVRHFIFELDKIQRPYAKFRKTVKELRAIEVTWNKLLPQSVWMKWLNILSSTQFQPNWWKEHEKLVS